MPAQEAARQTEHAAAPAPTVVTRSPGPDTEGARPFGRCGLVSPYAAEAYRTPEAWSAAASRDHASR